MSERPEQPVIQTVTPCYCKEKHLLYLMSKLVASAILREKLFDPEFSANSCRFRAEGTA